MGSGSLSIFQFHYGTIKREKTSMSAFNQLDFNSTMVRLKVFRRPRACNVLLFQFHYGTIKSQCNTSALSHRFISIPLWYD